ncbi:hypothetical protein [Segatella copri]|uniref:Uncharacterized protein n=1 Tax=Segatella copri TaxID=165179 RepID=A0AAW5U1H7_9BACT|nr:hypothetical protein [Segatella copri]MCW4094340.1 hypothetical protein [Segatella copri]
MQKTTAEIIRDAATLHGGTTILWKSDNRAKTSYSFRNTLALREIEYKRLIWNLLMEIL